MSEDTNKKNSAAELSDKALEEVAGGIYTREGHCSCYDPVTESGVTKCRKCGRIYAQLVP